MLEHSMGLDSAPGNSGLWHFAEQTWRVRRPKSFVWIIEGPAEEEGAAPRDYLHDHLLAPAWREPFLQWVDHIGLVVCLNLQTHHPSYRDVRGRSSKGRLSQGEYYHHDGCSSPQKPRLVEIRCPFQTTERTVATAAAPHHAVVRAMLALLPPELADAAVFGRWQERLAQSAPPSDREWDVLQGLINRTLRRKLSAEAARAYFRAVDHAADAYVVPWAMGESRLIANASPSGTGGATLQHRRAYLQPNRVGVANGSLVKRWPNEELPLPGQDVDRALVASFCSEEDGRCARGGE